MAAPLDDDTKNDSEKLAIPAADHGESLDSDDGNAKSNGGSASDDRFAETLDFDATRELDDDRGTAQTADFDESSGIAQTTAFGSEGADDDSDETRWYTRTAPARESLGKQTAHSSHTFSRPSTRELFEDPKALGEFTLVAKLGSGGFGEVFRATDVRLNRDVAIKLVKQNRAGDERQREDFLEEARNVAQLRHPNIVPVHQVGEIRSGSPFIVYEFIDGPTLQQRKRLQKRFLPYEAVELLTKIAEGLGCAHELGIVHRDVKPANILIDAKTGEPHIADFGCASRKSLDEPTKVDDSRSFVGTIAYFSPEQAAGKSYLADERTDVWAMGIIMDELLSGKRTFYQLELAYGGNRENLPNFLKQLQKEIPTPLRERVPAIDKDLDAIWGKCLARNPDDRYSNGNELADDLRRWQRNEPVRARPISLAERLVRWAKRNPQIAASLSAVFVTILLASIVAFALLRQTRQAHQKTVSSVIERVITTEADSLRGAIRQLRGDGVRSVAADQMTQQWRDLQPRMETMTNAEESRRAWRLSLGLVGLGAQAPTSGGTPSRTPGGHFVDQLISDATDPQELKASCRALTDSGQDLSWLVSQLRSVRDSAPPQQLRAECALSFIDEDDNPDGGKEVSRCLYELASRDGDASWVPLAQQQFADLPMRLTELRDSFGESSADVAVVEHLLVAASDHPADLIRQIAGLDRPLAGILPTLKIRFDALPKRLRFADFVRLSGGDENSGPTLTAKLWLAYLYCAEVDRDFAELDRHLLRPLNGAPIFEDRSAETPFVCEAFESGLPWQQLMQVAETWSTREDDRLAPALLALGDFPPPANIPEDTSQRLQEIWSTTSQAGTHSACDWLMRRWQIPRDTASLPSEYSAERDWRFQNGILFVRIRRPTSPFQIGTDPTSLDEFAKTTDGLVHPEHESFEIAHPHQVIGDFEISATEITNAQYQPFLSARLEATKDPDTQESSPRWLGIDQVRGGDDQPAARLNWYDAVEYCVWRSRQEGKPSCYGDEETVSEAYSKVRLLRCDRTSQGYRLPTSAEWELACRAGSKTLWPFGNERDYLEFYANTATSKRGGELQPPSLLRPNAWGLFDMLGNVAEWTDSPSRPFPADQLATDLPIRPEETEIGSFDYRGGDCESKPGVARSGRRKSTYVDAPKPGFRLVRSLPAE